MAGPDKTKPTALARYEPGLGVVVDASRPQPAIEVQVGTALKGIPPHELFLLPEMLPMAVHSACPSCGYDLMGLNGQHGNVTCVMHSGRILAISTYRCPECGQLARVPQGYVQPLCKTLMPLSRQSRVTPGAATWGLALAACIGAVLIMLLLILAAAA